MEGKTLIFSVLIMSLVMAQIQVEGKICCPSTDARTNFFSCLFRGGTRSICARISGCKIVDGECPEGYSNDILEHSGDAINEYCKLGCASSVCTALITLENSDASEIVNGAVEKCTKACSNFCNKGSKEALETTA